VRRATRTRPTIITMNVERFMNRILICVDGSEPALKALDFAAKLADETKAELVILTVTEELYAGNGALQEYAKAEHLTIVWEDLSEGRARETLSIAHSRAAVRGGLRIREEWRTGNSTAEILRFAREQECDVLVVGHVGRSRLAGVLLGSVAFKLVTLAPCPVTVVGASGQ